MSEDSYADLVARAATDLAAKFGAGVAASEFHSESLDDRGNDYLADVYAAYLVEVAA